MKRLKAVLGGKGYVRPGMETVGRSRDKRLKTPLWCTSLTCRTANSTGSALIFVRISGFGENPLKYTDPDGRTGSFPDNATDGVKWANNNSTSLLPCLYRE
jgi:hypothetical protein